jgi:hypothetical protein
MFRALDCFAVNETFSEVCFAMGAQTINHAATAVFEFDYGKSCVWRVKSHDIVCRNRRKVAGDCPLFAHVSG